MATTSIFASRPWEDEDDSHPNVDAANTLEETPYSPKRSSEALLRFLEIANKACVGVATELEPVHHQETLGEGLSFSVKAHLRKQSGSFVLKVFKHSLGVEKNAIFDQDRVRALMMEAHVLGSRPLHDHENIVTMTEIVFAVRSSNPLQISPALVLERAPHGTLSSFQQSVSKFHVSWATRKIICYDVAAGIKVLHECGIVHGDLKAENVLVFDHPVRGYVAKLSDFGSALILPTNVSASHRVRLSAYTPPWSAPEATRYIVPDEIPQTDVYSLGLLIWRILVHRNPFLTFDLALDPDIQLEQKRRILATPNISGLIPCFIEDEIGFLDADEILLLTQIFASTINVSPGLRSLDLILKLLLLHNGRQINEATAASKSMRLAPLSDSLTIAQPYLEWIQKFPYHVQSQVLLALEDFCGAAPIRNGQPPLFKTVEEARLREPAIWAVSQCHLLGIGTNPNPEIALDVLYYAGLPEYGRYWKSWIIIARLYQALDIKTPESRQAMTLAMALNAQKVSVFYQIILSDAEPNDHKVGLFHGIELARDRLPLTSLSSPDLDKNLQVNGTTALDNFEVGGNNTLLHASAFYDDVNLASYLTIHGLVDTNATNDLGETALLIACKYNSYDVLDHLLTIGADASITDERGENGLFWLTSLPRQSTLNIAKRLCANGAGLMWAVAGLDSMENLDLVPDSFFDDGRVSGGPLLQAIARRDLHSVKILLQLCIESFDEPLKLAESLFPMPLRLASEFHLFEILEFLCLQIDGVLRRIIDDYDSPEMVGKVLLYITKSSSILRGTIRMTHHTQRLCYHGKTWKEAAWKTMGVLHKFGFVTSHIVEFGSTNRTLNSAIACGSHEIVKELLSHQWFLESIDEADEQHYLTPVHEALGSRRLDILRLLIEKGATVDLRNKRDPRHNLSGVEASYLHVIASLRIEDNAFAETILYQGIPPDIKDNRSIDAFGLAMTRCSFDLGRLLLNRGYSLQTKGYFGLPVLAERFVEDMAKQHDDIYETVKFLISFDGPGDRSLFVIDSMDQTVLHIAAAYPLSDEIRYRDLLKLLLSHFREPEHVDAQCRNANKTTPLQMAIAMRNPIAAAALIEAGANMDIQDPGGSNLMELARSTIVKFLGMDTASKPKDVEGELSRAFQTLSILASRKHWPDDFRVTHQIKKALEVGKPLLDRMMRLSHQECYLLGLETQAMQLVNSQIQEVPKTLDGVENLRREVNSIIQPVLYAEIAAHISPGTKWASRQRDSYMAVRQRIPWCKTIVDARMSTFQQAAAFEWLLDEVRQHDQAENGKTDWYGLSRFARTADPAHLPIDHRFVRWPPTLLDWYIRVIQEDELDLTASEKKEVTSHVQVLRSRAAAQSRGEIALPQFPPEFKTLHFVHLQPEKLEIDTVSISTILNYRCRCYREKIRPWTISLIEVISRDAELYRDHLGTDLVDSLHAAKRGELKHKIEGMRWKNDIGVYEGEGRMERTGLRRRDSEAKRLEEIDEQKLRLLMSRFGLLENVDGGGFDDTDGRRYGDDGPGETEFGEGLADDVHGAPTPHETVSDSLPTSIPPAIAIEEDHIAATLRTYLYHAYISNIGTGFDRDTKAAISHIRDVMVDGVDEAGIGGRAAYKLEDGDDDGGGCGMEQEQVDGVSVPFGLVERRSTW